MSEDPSVVQRAARRQGRIVGSLIFLAFLAIAITAGVMITSQDKAEVAVQEEASPTTTVAPAEVAPSTTQATQLTVAAHSQQAAGSESRPTNESTPPEEAPQNLLPVWSAVALDPTDTARTDGTHAAGVDATLSIDGNTETMLVFPTGGVGHSLQIRLAQRAGVDSVGILPGNDAAGPDSDRDPSVEFQLVRVVRWLFDDGTEVIQEVSPDLVFQYADVPNTASETVRLEVLGIGGVVGNPGIAEVRIFGEPHVVEPEEPETITDLHMFPLDPANAGTYNPGGHGYPATDIFAPEGTPFVAVTSGVVDVVSDEDVWDPAVNDGANRGGLYVGIIGDDGVRYYGSHLSWVADGIEPGVRVSPGQILGRVGRSGNARETTPHLHFGISAPTFPDDWQTRRGQVDPVPFLDAWRAGDTSATPEIGA